MPLIPKMGEWSYPYTTQPSSTLPSSIAYIIPVQGKDKRKKKKKSLYRIQHRRIAFQTLSIPDILKEDQPNGAFNAYATTLVPHSKPLDRTVVACSPQLISPQDLASWMTRSLPGLRDLFFVLFLFVVWDKALLCSPVGAHPALASGLQV